MTKYFNEEELKKLTAVEIMKVIDCLKFSIGEKHISDMASQLNNELELALELIKPKMQSQ